MVLKVFLLGLPGGNGGDDDGGGGSSGGCFIGAISP